MMLIVFIVVLAICGGGGGIAFAGVLFILAGFATLLGQSAVFLYSGQWHALKGIDVLEKFISLFYSPPDYPWIFAPESWTGLHSLLVAAPASAALICFGFILIIAMMILGLIFRN